MMTILILAIYPILLLLAQIFPISTGFSTEFTDAIAGLSPYLSLANNFFPVGVLFNCLTLVISLQVLIYGFQFARWALSHVPFIGGKGSHKQ